MKRLWIAVAILVLLLAGSLVNGYYVQSLTERMTEQLEQAQDLAHQDQWDRAEQITQQTYEDWENHHFYLHTTLRHSDTDRISTGFRSVLQLLDQEEDAQYAAANADLVAQLELLAEMEQASLVNVL